jgi:hypothetical protein
MKYIVEKNSTIYYEKSLGFLGVNLDYHFLGYGPDHLIGIQK